MARLHKKYRDEIIPKLMKAHGYKNVHQVPKIEKISVNMGLGAAVQNPKIVDGALEQLQAITGQKAVKTAARKSIATFKLLQSTTLVENPDVVDDYFELCGKVLRCQPPMMLEATDLLPLIFECGTAALLLQHKEAARSALRFFDNLVDLFSRPGRGVTPLSRASLDALRSMLGSRGQQLVTAIVQAIAGELPASRVRFYSPLLKLLVEVEPRLCTTWATVAVQALPVDTHADGAVFVGSIFSTEALRDEKLFTAAADAFSDACRRKRTLVLGRRASSCDRELGR